MSEQILHRSILSRIEAPREELGNDLVTAFEYRTTKGISHNFSEECKTSLMETAMPLHTNTHEDSIT